MQGPHLRKYGVATTINFELYQTDGINLKTDAAHAASDTKIMKDEGDEADTTNAFVDEGQGYSLALTATEMQAARIVIYIVGQGTKVWLDKVICIETYGNASAAHAFDLGTATQSVNVASGGIAAASFAAGAIDAAAIADNAIDAGAIASAAITSAKFGTGAIDATAFAQGAADKVWGTAARTLTSFGTLVADVWAAATSGLTTVSSIGKKLADWVLGTDSKVLLSADAQTGVTIPTVTTVTNAVSVSGTVAANVTQIDGQATNGNNATLNLKQLNIVNSSGDAIRAYSQAGGNGINAVAVAGVGIRAEAGASGTSGISAIGNNTSPGILSQGGTNGASGMKLIGGGNGHGLEAEGGTGGATNGILATGKGASAIKANGTGSSCEAAHGIEAIGGGQGSGMVATGNLSGSGMLLTAGATGHGIKAIGGATSGHGIDAEATTEGNGVYAQGQGAGHGASFLGGATGDGVLMAAGGSGTAGLNIPCGGSSAHGINVLSGGNKDAIHLEADGSGNGITSFGGSSSGSGIFAAGESAGINAESYDAGHGIHAKGGSTSGDGIHTEARGIGDGIEAVGLGGGYDINADIHGSLDGSVDSVTDPVTAGTVSDKAGYSISGTKQTLDALNDLTAAAVNAECDTAISDAALATAASIAALNDLSAAEVNAEVVDALTTDTHAEPAAGAPPSPVSIRDMALYTYHNVVLSKMELNKTTGIEKVFKNDGTTARNKRTVTDDGVTTTKGAAVAA